MKHLLTYTTKPPRKGIQPIIGVQKARDPRLRDYVQIEHEHPDGEGPVYCDPEHPYNIRVSPGDILEFVVVTKAFGESTRASWMPVFEGIFFYTNERQTEKFPFAKVLSYEGGEGVMATANSIRLSQKRFTEEHRQDGSMSSVRLRLDFGKWTQAEAETFYYLLRFVNVSLVAHTEPGFGGILSAFDIDPPIDPKEQEG